MDVERIQGVPVPVLKEDWNTCSHILSCLQSDFQPIEYDALTDEEKSQHARSYRELHAVIERSFEYSV